jgi:Mak10 subunit, NatC N(alpha)-terminal acetyltransferase
MSWHSGNPLAQTLFTCTYLAELLFNFNSTGMIASAAFTKVLSNPPSTLKENMLRIVLRNYIVAVIKSSYFVGIEFSKRNVYEEEDASTNSAGLNMLNTIPVVDIAALLDDAVAVCTSTPTSPVLNAIQNRLRLRKLLLGILADENMSPEFRRNEIAQCQTYLDNIIDTLDLGKPSLGAFSTRVQRKLSISTPPRPMTSLDAKDAANLMKVMLNNLIEIDAIQESTSTHEIMVLI